MISLPAEFSWQGDACHTPYWIQIASDPVDDYNYNEYEIYTELANALVWAEPAYSSYLDGLTTSTGWYHWRVCNAYGTGCSETRAFRLQ